MCDTVMTACAARLRELYEGECRRGGVNCEFVVLPMVSETDDVRKAIVDYAGSIDADFLVLGPAATTRR